MRHKPAPAASLDSHTVGAYLRSLYPAQFNEEWVGRQLACEPAAARELLDCWVPTVTPQILERSIGVFAAHLGIDRKRLLSLMTGGSPAAAAAAPKVEFARPRSAPRPEVERPAAPAAIGAGREAGARAVTVTWQKPKRSFSVGAAPAAVVAAVEPAAAHKVSLASRDGEAGGAATVRRPQRKPPP